MLEPKKPLSIVLSLLLMISLLAIISVAAAALEAGDGSIAYVDAGGTGYTQSDFTVVDSSTENLADGWYVVTESVTNNNRLNVNGAVNLILCDGATLSLPEGIHVSEGNGLTIWAQEKGTGTLTIDGVEEGNAGIGGNHDERVSGKITVTINGGVINTTGGQFAAGIGSAYYNSDISFDITINGGTVTARGGEEACAIGDGHNTSSEGGNITINGGAVTAVGNGAAYGIGLDPDNDYAVERCKLTLNWTNDSLPNMSVYANNYYTDIVLSQSFKDKASGTVYAAGTYRNGSAYEEDHYKGFDGKTLVPNPENGWSKLQEQINNASDGDTITLSGYDYTATSSDTALTIPLGKTITLDLNGYTIDRNLTEATTDGCAIFNQGYLTIKGPGTITGGNDNLFGGAVKSLLGLTIEGGVALTGNSAVYGGAIFGNSDISLSDCTITDNYAERGGAIYCELLGSAGDYSLTINNCTITDNTAPLYEGYGYAGIYAPGWTINISGATVIKDNTTVSGVENLYVTDPINITGSLEGAYIGVTTEPETAFTSGLPGNGTADNFFADNSDYLVRTDDAGEAVLKQSHTVTVVAETGGSASASPQMAREGDTIALTVTPEAGYYTEKVELSYTEGEETRTVDITGQDSFTMPDSDVTVTATFAQSPVAYVDQNGAAKEPITHYTVVTSSLTTMSEGWYIVSSSVTNNNRVRVQGNVNLILCDGAKYSSNQGIRVSSGNSLTIWQQEEGTGELYFKMSTDSYNEGKTAIGSNKGEERGDITINGGIITAHGSGWSCGIGSGRCSVYSQQAAGNGAITINAGTVEAKGAEKASGIGGSYGISGGTITINGGSVDATGALNVSAIGAGESGQTNKTTVTINGGIVTAHGAVGTRDATISLSWSDPDEDSIYASNYSGTVKLLKSFRSYTDEENYTVYEATDSANTNDINGKTLVPDAQKYTVTWANYDGTVLETDEVWKGSTPEYNGSTPIRYNDSTSTYYLFDGWTKDDPDTIVNLENETVAADVTYTAHYIECDKEPVAYVNAKGEAQKDITEYEAVIDIMPEYTLMESISAWWVVLETTAIDERLVVEGNVNLILRDDTVLTLPKGVTVNEGSSLTIWQQEGGTGALTIAAADSGNAGIGSSSGNSSGVITINGGTITVSGGQNAAGIGGNDGSGTVVINNGEINATAADGGAGIGGETVAIVGGSVIATGGTGGVGIGVSDNADSCTVILTWTNDNYDSMSVKSDSYQGTVKLAREFKDEDGTAYYATDNANASALAGKTLRPFLAPVAYVDASGAAQTPVEEYTLVSDSTTSMSGGWYVVRGSVENANRIEVKGTVNLILCDGAELNATKGIKAQWGQSANLTIWQQEDGTGMLSATATDSGYAGIGGNSGYTSGDITINGGVITATGAKNGAGIGSGNKQPTRPITINGGQVTATGGSGAAGIGGGRQGVGRVYIYGGEVNATGGSNGAGIGAGASSSYVSGKKLEVTISGGKVTATGGSKAAGIGSGYQSTAGSCAITLSGGQIVANAGRDGCGINSSVASNNEIELSWTDEVKESMSVRSGSYAGNVTLSSTFKDYDTGVIYDVGALDDLSTLDNSTIRPYERMIVYNSLTLNGDIGVNYYLRLSSEQLAQGVTVTFAWNGKTESVTFDSDSAPETREGVAGMYKATCCVCAAEMNDEITASITIGSDAAPVETELYKVKDYADFIIDNPGRFSEKLVALVKAMLNYGAYAQVQFNHNTEALANEGVDYELVALGESEIDGIAGQVPNKETIASLLADAGIEYYGYSLVLNTKTTLRFYFRKNGADIAQLATQLTLIDSEGQSVGTVVDHNASYCYIEVADIPAVDLDECFELKFGDISLGNYSALSYAKDVLLNDAGAQPLTNTVTALYRYNEAAADYFESMA